MYQPTEKDARRLLKHLEQHWQVHYSHYSRKELHRRLNSVLPLIKQALARDSKDTRKIIITYHRSLKHEVTAEEITQANAALARILVEMGAIVVSLMPLAFITLPGLFALARHFDIELLPEKSTRLGNSDESD